RRADDALSPADDPGRQKVQREVPVAELDRVTGVVASVVARDDVETAGEQVHDLPLPLVSPLSAEDRHDLHVFRLSSAREERRKIAALPLLYNRAHLETPPPDGR